MTAGHFIPRFAVFSGVSIAPTCGLPSLPARTLNVASGNPYPTTLRLRLLLGEGTHAATGISRANRMNTTGMHGNNYDMPGLGKHALQDAPGRQYVAEIARL
jgi:hypothetical protein